MNKYKLIPLDEKLRILFCIFNDIIIRKPFLKLSASDLSENQFIILRILAKTGPHSLNKIAEALNISSAAASKNIDYLVRKRFINRREEPDNRRKVKLSILSKGKRLVYNYNQYCENKLQSILSHYNENEHQIFNEMIDKLINLCVVEEENLTLFCLRCGGKYEGYCPIWEIKQKCYFHLSEKINNN